MKKVFKIGFAMVLIVGIAWLTKPLSAQITGSKHDMSSSTANTISSTDTDRICIFCHTPHSGTNPQIAPLWNHVTTVSAFTMYYSATLDGTIQASPASVSLACLSCHDGATAVNDLTNNMGSGAGTDPTMQGLDAGNLMPAASLATLGTDLTFTHPISLQYDTALATADGELHDPSSTASGLGGNIDGDMLFGASNDQLECASCHDVHDDTIVPFLIKDNAASALCLTCHNK